MDDQQARDAQWAVQSAVHDLRDLTHDLARAYSVVGHNTSAAVTR